MTSTLPRILISVALTFGAVSCGSRSAGIKPIATVRYLEAEPKPCLKVPPPTRPTIQPCPTSDRCPDEDIMVARLLDYLDRLDRWSSYAWTICKAP